MNKLDKKIFGTLFFSIFSAVTGVGIVVPLLPVFAHGLGASGLYIGMIFGSFSLSRTLLLPCFGKWSDRRGRKPFIVTGLFAYSLVSVAFIFSKSVEGLIAIRFLQGIASAMIMPVTQAYVGDITPKGREGFCMGLFNLSMFASLSIGPLLGGFINEAFTLKSTFVAMGFLSLIGFALSLTLLPPTKSETMAGVPRNPVPWRKLLSHRRMQGLFGFRFAYTTCIGIIWCFLPVLSDSAFGLTSSAIGVLVTVGVITSGLLHTPMGFLADRWNRRAMVCTGGAIVCVALFSIEWANGFSYLFSAILLFGIGGGIAMPALMAMAVQEGNRNTAMGSIMAIMTMGHSLGMLTGSLLAGIAMDFFQLRHAFPVGAMIMAAGTLYFFLSTTSISDTAGKPVSEEGI